jgi:hypothetical protein
MNKRTSHSIPVDQWKCNLHVLPSASSHHQRSSASPAGSSTSFSDSALFYSATLIYDIDSVYANFLEKELTDVYNPALSLTGAGVTCYVLVLLMGMLVLLVLLMLVLVRVLLLLMMMMLLMFPA